MCDWSCVRSLSITYGCLLHLVRNVPHGITSYDFERKGVMVFCVASAVFALHPLYYQVRVESRRGMHGMGTKLFVGSAAHENLGLILT